MTQLANDVERCFGRLYLYHNQKHQSVTIECVKKHRCARFTQTGGQYTPYGNGQLENLDSLNEYYKAGTQNCIKFVKNERLS